MSNGTVGHLVEKGFSLNSRQVRRALARELDIEFVPQYNGAEPVRGKHKDVIKREKQEKRKADKNKGE